MEKEEKKENALTNPPPHHPPLTAKKRGGTMSLLRAALFMIQCNSSTKKNPINANAGTADTVLKTLVGSMRPLHHQLNFQHPPPPPPPLTAAVDSFHDVSQPPPSPADGMSCYSSAEDLRLLDMSEGVEEVVDGSGDGNGEPNTIDVKAEEFIAKFYKQMRLQRSESFNHTVIEQGAC